MKQICTWIFPFLDRSVSDSRPSSIMRCLLFRQRSHFLHESTALLTFVLHTCPCRLSKINQFQMKKYMQFLELQKHHLQIMKEAKPVISTKKNDKHSNSINYKIQNLYFLNLKGNLSRGFRMGVLHST
jgi:hypothetical protein